MNFHKLTLLEWAKRRTHTCPDCGGVIPRSWMKMTAWCDKCFTIWRVRRFEIYSDKLIWYHITDGGKPIKRRNKNATNKSDVDN